MHNPQCVSVCRSKHQKDIFDSKVQLSTALLFLENKLPLRFFKSIHRFWVRCEAILLSSKPRAAQVNSPYMMGLSWSLPCKGQESPDLVPIVLLRLHIAIGCQLRRISLTTMRMNVFCHPRGTVSAMVSYVVLCCSSTLRGPGTLSIVSTTSSGWDSVGWGSECMRELTSRDSYSYSSIF